MNMLHHPKLIRLHDAFEDEDEMVLIYEFMSGGELFERITAEDYKMSEAEVINYMRQLCEGVKHMHEKNIIHLDIKPENIMCQTKTGNNIKLIDFGLATKLDPNEVVRISTGTAEFAAPEIVDREPVGFYTDMWAIGVLAYVLLSGLSPFAGENDIETLKNVRACDWDFDDEAFANVSDSAKDFIRRLLTRNKEKRLTAHECLAHPWLMGDISAAPTTSIPSKRYIKIRDRIRAKYGDYWFNCLLPIGHIANYSSLRKLHEEKYNIHEFYFDRRQAAPRFVIRPQSTFSYEGQSAKFYCRVIAAAPATVTWYRDGYELRQSVKYMKRYQENDYYFILNRCKVDDRGEYIIRAENSYGFREEPVFLNVQSVPREIPHIVLDEPIRRRYPPLKKLWEEPVDSAPCFTFHLRTRVIQVGIGVKLLCCLSGKPTPEIKWFKDGREINKYDYNVTHSDGVVILEILSCTMEDAGTYVCRATNKLGEDETTCHVIMEDRRGPPSLKSPVVVSPIPPSPSPRPSPYAYDTYSRDYSSSHAYSHTSDYVSHKQSSYSSAYSSTKISSQSYSSTKISSRSDYLSTRYTPSPRASPARSLRLDSPSRAMRSSPARSYGTSLRPETPTKRTQKPYGASKKEPSSPQRSRTATKELEIPDDVEMTAPSFKEQLKDTKIKDGESLTLKCVVSGIPEPQVEWLKNGEKLFSSDIIDLKYKNNVAMLSIGEVFPEDDGDYVCRATNSLGTAATKCKLTVLPMDPVEAASKAGFKPPRISQHLKSMVVKDGDSVTLQCTITCPNTFDVVWLHNDREIKPSNDFQYKTEGDAYKLIIGEIFPEDGGIYTCEAFNDVGDAFSSCTLIVTVPNEPVKGPGFVKFPESVTIHKGQSVTFSAETEKDAKKVTWMKDGNPIDTSSTHHQFSHKGRKCSLTIPNAIDTNIGQYTLVVSDGKDECAATFSLNVLTEGDV
ncbi:myosin light chain kinase, smooth muscle-like [Centruroides sculpturatus]|nr:myosin light chain kinase, smooth muscle-like [Centruroides sculpturatus]XP_023233614.1 myosin light chain kinase, smooth muscle-like [Centruroides sculpturatus]